MLASDHIGGSFKYSDLSMTAENRRLTDTRPEVRPKYRASPPRAPKEHTLVVSDGPRQVAGSSPTDADLAGDLGAGGADARSAKGFAEPTRTSARCSSSRTPRRISFAGGGSDILAEVTRDHGAVLSGTIEKYVSGAGFHFRIVRAASHTDPVPRPSEAALGLDRSRTG